MNEELLTRLAYNRMSPLDTYKKGMKELLPEHLKVHYVYDEKVAAEELEEHGYKHIYKDSSLEKILKADKDWFWCICPGKKAFVIGLPQSGSVGASPITFTEFKHLMRGEWQTKRFGL